MTQNTPRVVIVGAGLRGRIFGQVVASEHEAQLVGFVDPGVSAESITFDGVSYPVWKRVDDAFAAEKITAAIVATPDFLHADAVEQLAQRGCALMLEKPVATNAEDTERIERAVSAAGIYCMVAFENRWTGPFQAMRSLVEAGEIGAPVFQAARLSNSYYVPTQMLSWAAQSSPLWFLMPHTVDLVQWLAGSHIQKVTAMGTRGILASRGIDTWDVVHAIAQLEDGSTASLTSAWVLPDGHPAVVDFTYELVGESSSAFADVGRSGLQHFSERHHTLGVGAGMHDGVSSAPPAWMVREFLRDVRQGRAPQSPIETGIQVNKVLFAIERALISGNSEVVE